MSATGSHLDRVYLNMTILSMEGVGDSLGGGEKNKGPSTTAHYKRFIEMITCQ